MRFEDQLRAELPVLYRVARRLAGTSELAEDVLGQTLLSAWRARSTFDGRHLRSWLIRILRNEFHGLARKGAARQEQEIDESVSSEESPWIEVANRIDVETLMAELNQMSEEHRLIIQLCDIEEMSYEHAAAALDIPIGTVRSRLFRAREKLRDRCAGRLSFEVKA